MIPFMYFNNVDKVWIVKLARCYDLKGYDTSWMSDSLLPAVNWRESGEPAVLVPDLDLCEGTWVFDQSHGTPVERERAALQKMKELWSKVTL